MKRRFLACAFLSLMIGTLAACGSTTPDRALSGAAIGAGAGAIGGGLLFGSPAAGALVGGAAGGAIGALTDPGTVNLGQPVWD